MADWIPDAGDVVWLNFSPQVGHEQAGHRPALVLSDAKYNARIGLMICCPMTTQIKGYPFEVLVAGEPASVVLSDQVKSLDWRRRNARLKDRISSAELAQVKAKIAVLVGIDTGRQ